MTRIKSMVGMATTRILQGGMGTGGWALAGVVGVSQGSSQAEIRGGSAEEPLQLESRYAGADCRIPGAGFLPVALGKFDAGSSGLYAALAIDPWQQFATGSHHGAVGQAGSESEISDTG